MRRLLALTAGLALAALLAACSSASGAQPGSADPAASTDPNGPAIAAKDLKFSSSELTVPAGKPIELSFSNQDGAPHNVAIYTDTSASKSLFVGEIFGGPGSKTYTVPALAAGSYFFRCDVHPDMKGTLVAR